MRKLTAGLFGFAMLWAAACSDNSVSIDQRSSTKDAVVGDVADVAVAASDSSNVSLSESDRVAEVFRLVRSVGPGGRPEEDSGLSRQRMVGSWRDFDEMHAAEVTGFIASEGFGVSRRLVIPVERCLPLADADYRAVDVQLVSLLNHKTPVAYKTNPDRFKSKFVKREDGKHPTRPLSDFEAEAIESLRAGEAYVLSEPADHRVAVGALRAEASCLECHSDAEEGDLLGAFTYVLEQIDKID